MGEPCACIYVSDDTESVESLTSEYRRANKEHKCKECRRIIHPGEKYYYETFKHEGDMGFHKTCQDCMSLRKELFCSGFEYGNILNLLQDHVAAMEGKVFCDGIANLTPSAQRVLFKMVEDYWEDHPDE
nr:hypothetical protein 20 [Candidatus Omnitrophota bacterium]